MGFNNGYDAGYHDCETDNRKRWEREAVERFKKTSSGKPQGSASTKLPIKLLKGHVMQLVNNASEAVLDQNDYPVATVEDGSFSLAADFDGSLVLCCIPAGQSTVASTPFGSDGKPGDFYTRPGLYIKASERTPAVEWADLSLE